MAADVHYCPRCELRFTNTSELQEHFTIDHDADPDAFARFRYPNVHRSPSGLDRRLLVVANQTLDSEHVVDEIIRSGATARIFLLVPATPAADLVAPLASRPAVGSGGTADDVGAALARWRLRKTIDRLHIEGVDAEGQVGHPDPMTAVTRLFRSERFDEILLSTLPPAGSRWLQADLPARLERQCHIPVRTLVAAAVP